MQDMEFRQSIFNLLKDMEGLDPLKELFWTELNYERVNTPLPRRNWSDKANNAIVDDPILFAEYKDFHVIYSCLNSEKLLLGLERSVINRLIQDHNLALFIFSDIDQKHWHFVNVKYENENGGRNRRRIMRRIAIGPYERLRTATERISMLDIESIRDDKFDVSALAVQQRHDQAFDVEAVTKEFFENYKIIFRSIEKQLLKQNKDNKWAHDYTLLFLNRLMFLYFVQRKRWIGDDPEFINNYWKAYKGSKQPKDTFFSKWLDVLFFEAFNNKFKSGMSDRQHIPDKIRSALSKAPYLNGGLFSKKELDEKYMFSIPDNIFIELFDRYTDLHNRTCSPGFLEGYNFTIREDSPFDQEVAVDPEMLGKVYESLINLESLDSNEIDQRGSAGIFYTPRIEIDMMCRLSLVDWLSNNLGDKYKPLLYETMFAYDPEECHSADDKIAKENLSQSLYDLLREITVLDPACGSGSFLVGMLNVLDSLQERLQKQLGINETSYERMKRIIGQNLYGVDVMDWAVHVAELRMWLQLIIETQLNWHDMKMEPLLPNLSFKIRQGDSLVQEVGGINFEKGFDIVIGNPPYVRQEKIAPYDKKEDDYSAEEWRQIKKEYKEKLQKSISMAYPEFFPKGIDNKSDLYVYFYLHGLSLLNDKGSFCFITSNSWLDVGYGKDLQEFLLKNCRIKMIIDNQAKRSFAQADVNTIITLLSAPTVSNIIKNLGTGHALSIMKELRR